MYFSDAEFYYFPHYYRGKHLNFRSQTLKDSSSRWKKVAPVQRHTFNEPKSVRNSVQNYHDQTTFLPLTSHTADNQTTLNIPTLYHNRNQAPNRAAFYYKYDQVPVQSVTFSDPKAVDNAAQNYHDQTHFLPLTSHNSSNQTTLNTPTLS